MLNCFIRDFSVFILSIYAFFKLLNIQTLKKHTCFLLLLIGMSVCLFTSYFFTNNQSLNWICILLTLLFIMKLITKVNLSITYITVLFSFSLSFISFCFSSLIVTLLFSLFYYDKYLLPMLFMRIIATILHLFLISICFRIPRLQNGMKFLYNIPSNNIGSSLCIFLIMLIIILCKTKAITQAFTFIFTALIIIIGFLLIYWWNYHITQTYRKFLRRNELNSLNLLLEEKNQKILYLKSQNDELARLIHKDNKIIPAITSAIMESYENKTTLDLTEWETDSPLCLKLKQLYDERVNMLETYHNEIMHLPKTGFDSINATLSFMHSEASKGNIPFQIVLYDNLKSTIPDEITEDDFNHMLSDLLSNAINACKNASSGSIQIYLGKTEEISIIKICNTGSVFHLETLKNFGLARHTTHADTGGSGIGLMDIWKIKEKYKATLLIDEITTASSSETYTCMNILFNHKNHYMIQSDRYKELNKYINRPDSIIISKE